MQSRTRKILRCESDGDAIIKQLQNDFEVFEYLKENKLETTNIEEYAKLFNSLVVEQQQRTCTYNRIQSEYNQLKQKQLDPDEELLQSRMHILDMIQQKTCKEMEISNDLEKEIIETKKSLNLLKGDIGHLVCRNQSAKLLSSKIAKVKIVAEDQFKRVSLAYIKDKQEIKLRNEMQKKFSKKLKNVSNYQNNGLGRLKKNYAESVLKKQDIFEKLLTSQKISENVEEAEMLKELKAEKDMQNQQQMEILLHLACLAEEFTISKLSAMITQPNELVEKITNYYNNLPQAALNNYEGMSEKVDAAVSQILNQYCKLEESIKNMSQLYQELLSIRKENEDKLQQYEREQAQLMKKFSIQLEENYKIDRSSERSYQLKLKQFGDVLSSLFVILSYLEKNVAFQTSYPLQYKLFSFEKQEESRCERKSTVEDRQSHFDYISSLSRVHHHLLSTSFRNEGLNFSPERHQKQVSEFYGSLLDNVRQWLDDIKRRFSDKYFEQLLESKKSRSSATRYSILVNSRRNTHLKKQSSSLHQDDEDIHESQKEEINFITQSSGESYQYSKSPSTSSLPHSTQQSIKAKRIKLLEGIDSDYYKMIKSTIKMEKENTRKNYQFLRTFKRAKYASRDNILQQKRFESSFSVLFTKQSVPNLTKTSKIQNYSSNFNTRTLNQSLSRSFFKKSTNKLNSSGTNTPILEGKTLFNKSQLQAAFRKSRMTQKLKQAMQFL